jgi:hypothetical protein
MNPTVTLPEPQDERRRQAAYRRLGTNDPGCLACGEGDWRCLELHHVAGHAYDNQTVILCRNCHRKQSEADANAPDPAEPPIMVRAGQFLLGLAQLLDELVSRFRSYGQHLLDGAAVCPWPYGWVGAPAGSS